MTLAVVATSILVFLAALRLSGIDRRAADALGIMRDAVDAMRSDALDDDAKERIVRRRAVELVKRAAVMVVTTVAVCAAPFLTLLASHALGLSPLNDSLRLITRWETIAAALAGSLAIWLIRR